MQNKSRRHCRILTVNELLVLSNPNSANFPDHYWAQWAKFRQNPIKTFSVTWGT